MQSSSYRTCLICGSSYAPRRDSQKYCSHPCRNAAFSDPEALGRRRVRDDGYIGVYVGRGKWALEHRLVMEQLLGRKLDRREQVHHKDHDRQNNSPDNLELTTIEQHMREHHSGLRWSRIYDACIECGTTERRHSRFGRCWLCDDRLQRSLVPKPWHTQRKHEACVKCGKTEHPYYRRGLCHGCKADQRWSKNANACVQCGTTDRRHMALGLCITCYDRR